uniref:Retrovirus-related Pol polyprotein from transposon TNT 1-94 n=1 Tax=Tanacetum cinerariifolium TaxID=118510 RepID=A0A699GK91_TANCI|nr:hypothetical protein [Tanacetum cinerariifolium]
MLKKYGLDQCDAVDIPMVGQSKLDEGPNGTPVDPIRYRGMIGSLMYLIASRTDLVFVVCMCARYQAKPNEKHLTTDFGYVRLGLIIVKSKLKTGKNFSYSLLLISMCCDDAYHVTPRVSALARRDNDRAGCQDSRKSTSGSAQLLGENLDETHRCSPPLVENEVVELYFVKTDYQLVDIFIKALAKERFEFLIKRIGMQRITPEEMKRLAESDEK